MKNYWGGELQFRIRGKHRPIMCGIGIAVGWRDRLALVVQVLVWQVEIGWVSKY